MEDLSSKIKSILSDPQALSQLKGLGESLGLTDAPDKPVHNNENNNSNMLSALGGDASQLQMLTKLMPMLSSMNTQDDTSRLLGALRPFLSNERQRKLDQASKMIKIFRLLPMMKDLDIFS